MLEITNQIGNRMLSVTEIIHGLRTTGPIPKQLGRSENWIRCPWRAALFFKSKNRSNFSRFESFQCLANLQQKVAEWSMLNTRFAWRNIYRSRCSDLQHEHGSQNCVSRSGSANITSSSQRKVCFWCELCTSYVYFGAWVWQQHPPQNDTLVWPQIGPAHQKW